MKKHCMIKSKHRAKKHISIIVATDNQEEAESIKKKVRETIHKQNRLSDKKYSYTLIIDYFD